MSVVVLKNGFRHAGLKLAAGAALTVASAAALAAREARAKAPQRTGRLKGSISSSGNVVRAEVRYAGFVERGTSKMAAEPYFFPAVHDAEVVLRQGLTKVLRSL